MDYFRDAFQRYADFSGRSRRSAYWYFVLFNTIFAVVALGIDLAIFGFPILYIVYALVALIPGLAVAIRRLHDTSRSGWWILISLVPLVGGIILLVFLATDSTPGENQYGPNPKEIGNDDIAQHLVE